eukprot:CAMPEP_0116061348 /NCGR_PEP_ID=MMETSP0322-20121206/7029_1 /TAXON_ID=163516 /ORGANISM="Leptocylindrus danicus var. apora, Strain B651" /LENGTH=637 /DNA_ID=CAMNT_0003546285 /DNA_START=79 /DNA_END=1992 /DNA_ORIENTATION=-
MRMIRKCIVFFLTLGIFMNILFMTIYVTQTMQDVTTTMKDMEDKLYSFTAFSGTLSDDRNSQNQQLITTILNQNQPIQMNTKLLSCIQQRRKCRYDDIGDFLEGTGPGIVHKPLSCIPQHRRIPHDKANDWQYILDQRAMLPEDGSRTALMDYNAQLLPLYKNVKQSDGTYTLVPEFEPKLLDRITGRYHPYFNDEEADRVKYLSISRSSNLHSCKPKFKFYFGTLAQDFLGLSLLDENLSRIEGTDVAINIDKFLFGNMTAIFHDFQIIAQRTTKVGGGDNGNHGAMKDQLFIFPSGHIGTFGFPIDIRRVPPVSQSSNYDPIAWNTNLFKSKGGTTNKNYEPIPFSHEYMYGDGFEVRLLVDKEGLSRRRSPGDFFFSRTGIDRGKNFHFFESRNGDTYMELWPHGSHRTVPVNFLLNETMTTEQEEINEVKLINEVKFFSKRHFKHIPKGRYIAVFEDMVEGNNLKREPQFSFLNKTPKHERPYKRFRGTSQIINLSIGGKEVKVGLSHTVAEGRENVTDRRTYLNQFYAFEPDPPFNVVALTGHFCFNHMNEDDIGYSAQWISRRPVSNRTFPILIDGDHFRCPIIAFPMGMTEMIGYNASNVIITYGVNDCYSRSIVVPKRKIEMLLLGISV